jgi:predicted PurR-regulated permease PerM
MSELPVQPVVLVTPQTSTLRRWGSSAWNLIGLIVFAGLAMFIWGALSSVTVPLTIAVWVGILASPLVDLMQRHHVPRPLGAFVVMIGLVVVFFGSIYIAVVGVIDQSDEISSQLTAGLDELNTWLSDHRDLVDDPSGAASNAVEMTGQLIGGLASYASSIFSGLIAFLMGGFFALFFLYYVLSDWDRLSDWVGRHLGVHEELGRGIIDDTTNLTRRAFYALTLSSVVTAVLIGLTMVLLDLPLAFVVAIVTFVTSYIPYLGAIFSGVFGFLVALGAGGMTDAIILLVVILVVQNIVQTVVGNRLTSSQLSLHPIASLIATLVGAAVAGLLGAILAAPALAVALAIRRRVRAFGPERDQEMRDRIRAGDVGLTP